MQQLKQKTRKTNQFKKNENFPGAKTIVSFLFIIEKKNNENISKQGIR